MASFIEEAAEEYSRWVKGNNKSTSMYFSTHRTTMEKTLDGYRSLRASKNIDEIINTEKSVLTLYRTYADSTNKSIQKALDDSLHDIDVMQKFLTSVRSGQYVHITDTFSEKVQGVPVDGFHIAAKDHMERLNDYMINPALEACMKEEFRLRKENIKLVYKLYQVLQKEALGV